MASKNKTVRTNDIKNEIILHDGYVEIIVTHPKYNHSILIDCEDLTNNLGKLRISNDGYGVRCNSKKLGGASNLARFLLNCYDKTKDVDHKSGDTLDNRKANLRICDRSTNSRNRRVFTRNNTGRVGIQYRENRGYKYYRVSFTKKEGGRKTKQFNINKLGREEAFRQANEYLLEMKKMHNYYV
jgi:hypothetical protein